jgi:branched-chain amino acid transport system permease protein
VLPLEVWLKVIASGLFTGLVYGLSALGLSVIFGVMRVVNFAHGEMMVLGMFAAVLLFRWFGIEPLWAVPVVGALLFALGYVLQAGVVNRLIQAPEHMQFLLMASVAIVLLNLCLMLFGPNAQNVPLAWSYDSWEIAGLVLDKTRVLAALAALVLAGLLFAFFRFSKTGTAIRACADNFHGAQVVGLNVYRLYAFTFGIGAACVGAAGAIVLMLVDVHPHLAVEYTLLAFVIVIVGGLGSQVGALVGGMLIGASEAIAALLLSPSLKSLVSFGLLIAVLLFRPQGLLGRKS